jgi:acetyl-CoA C-acetyltransferase
MPANALSRSLPAIAGAAQFVQRPGEAGDDPLGPIELMVTAARAAAADAGSDRLLRRVGWIGVAGGYWRYRNPGSLIAGALGCEGAATALASLSGSAPQEMVGRAARLIAQGDVDAALVVGGEARYTSQRLKRAGQEPRWETAPGTGEPERVGGSPEDERWTGEFAVFGAPAVAYALMSDSLRASEHESVDDHRTRLAQLWKRFSDVAVDNPYAWDRTPHSVAAIRDPHPGNRMIAFPYTKAMVANNGVDMGSALLLCSTTLAGELGVASDRLVFPHVVTRAHETWLVAERNELHGSPALAAAGRAAMDHAGIGPDDVAHVDLYACFPSIVMMSASALGFDTRRALTVTGGLGFAGAPVGNAAGQSIAAIVGRVRDGGWGVVHANGGHATKHAFGVYAAHPPERFVLDDVQTSVDLQARAVLDDGWSGEATVEAATVVFDRHGPSHALAAVRPAGGRLQAMRGWGRSTDPGIIDRATTTGIAGATVRRSVDGEIG